MFFVFFLFWLLLNGQWTTEIALVGLFLSGLLYLFVWKFMGYSPRKEWAYARRLPRFLWYLCFLVAEIFRASWQTIRFIWSPRLEVEPRLAAVRTRARTEAGRVLLADSITMTPGTITVSLRKDRMLIHCLDESLAEGLEGSEMEKRVMRLEGGSRNA